MWLYNQRQLPTATTITTIIATICLRIPLWVSLWVWGICLVGLIEGQHYSQALLQYSRILRQQV